MTIRERYMFDRWNKTRHGTWLIAVLFCAFAFTGSAFSETFFVDNVRGDDNDDGGIFDPWATIQHAIDDPDVGAGDTIYVRATGEPYAPFTVDKEWIEIVGWEAQGGSRGLDDGSGVPDDYDEILDDILFESLDEQPIIADPLPDRENAIGITVEADHVAIRNFDITDVAWGCKTDAVLGASLFNIYVYDVGDKVLGGGAGEDGRGILLYRTTESYVHNCVVYNSAGYGISAHEGYFNSIQNCGVYCDDNSNGSISATHYYFVLQNEIDSRIDNCSAERYEGPEGIPQHGGHGFCVFLKRYKSTDVCEDNTVELCKAESMKDTILMRGNATNNTFREVEGKHVLPYFGAGWVSLETGPHGNLFERVRLIDALWAVRFRLDLSWESAPVASAKDNRFVNCIFQCKNGLHLDPVYNPGDVEDNKFLACTIVGDESPEGRLFLAKRGSSNNRIESCIVTGFKQYADVTTGGYTPDAFDFLFHKCCLFNPGSNFPAASSLGFGNIEGFDPMFFGSDFEILSGSECIGKGVYYPDYNLDVDYDPRGNPPDIGAQEHVANP